MRSLVSWVAQRRPDAQTAPSARWLMFGHSVTWGENSHGQAGSSGFSGLSQSANLGQSSRGPQAGGNGGDLCLCFPSRAVGGLLSLCLLRFVQPLREPFVVALRSHVPGSVLQIGLALWPSGAPPPECRLRASVSVQWVGHSRPRRLPDSHGRSRGVHTKCSGFRIRTF